MRASERAPREISGVPTKPKKGVFGTGPVVASVLSADIATEDCDGDTLTDETELGLGSDPHLVDTNGDGWNDNVDPQSLNPAVGCPV